MYIIIMIMIMIICNRFCQFLIKLIPIINCVYACVRTSAEDGNFPREGGRCVYLIIFVCFALPEKALFQVIFGLLGISIRSFI